MKGQMFIVAALVMIITIVGLKDSLSLQKILENQRHLVSGFDSLEFQNIRSEMTRVVQNSFNSTSGMTDDLNNFNSFVKDSLQTKNIEFDSFLVELYYPVLQPSTNAVVNVTVLNSLGTEMKFLNITFNGTSGTFALSNGNILRTSFTINTAVSVNQTMNIFYNTSASSQTETVTVPLTLGSSKYVAFYDIRYINSGGQQSDKFTTVLTLV